jgi:NADH-quinone oxidoreductase subunit C
LWLQAGYYVKSNGKQSNYQVMASSKSYERKVEVTLPEVQVRLQSALEAELAGKFQLCQSLRWDEYGLAISIATADVKQIFAILKDGAKFKFNMLVDLTAVDWLDQKENRFEVVYQLLSLTHMHRLCVKVGVSEKSPELESVRPLWDSAWFMEREVFDFFGIKFNGNGDMRRILMYDEFQGYPLRKDYPVRAKQPRIPLRVPELRNTSADMHREQLVALPTRSKKSQNPETIPSE